MNFLKTLGLVLLLVLTGCSQKEETPPTPKTGVALVAIGPINFGGVLVGEYRDAAVRVFNYGPEALDTTSLSTKLTAPFFVQSISGECATGSLPANSNCIVAVRFFPNLAGSFEQDFTIGNASIRTTGRGLVGGVMDISETYWDVGQTYAGVQSRKTFTITNLGDFTIAAPTITLVPGVSVGLNTCGSFIATLKNCKVELIAAKTISGVTSEVITFNAQNGGTLNVTIDNTVLPGLPSGTIGFLNAPNTIVADGDSVYTITSQVIRDQYGNMVADGTGIRISASNAELLTSSPQLTVNGQVSFSFKSPTSKGFATISLLSSEASGFLRAFATSGPPVGSIQVEGYTPSVTANGQTQIIFKTLALRDQYGNVVEDGTQVYYFLEGGGSIGAPFNFTVLGISQMSLTASTVVGNATFKIRAGPIYDSNNNIVDWRAQGDFPVSYTPGLAAGNIPITSVHNAIYAVEDIAYEQQGLPIRTTVTVGPVRDAYGNIVAPNTQLSLNMTGGKNITYQNQPFPITVYTDSLGMISFIIAGNGTRGNINISVSGGANASGNLNVWAFTDSRFTPNNNFLENKFKIYETFEAATALPSLTKKWASFGANDFSAMSGNDGSSFKIKKNNTTAVRTYLTSIDYLQAPCWFSRKQYLQVGPCSRDEFFSKSSLSYVASNDNGNDSSPSGPSHRPFITRKDHNNNNILQGGFAVGLHDPGDRDGWESILGSPIHPGIGFLPSNNTYLAFGGMLYEDTLNDFCPRVTLDVLGASAQITCSSKLSCSWNVSTLKCNYRSDTSFFGRNTSYSSIYFDMDKDNQSVASTFRHSAMDADQIGDYPPAMAHLALVNDGNNKLYGFGGFMATEGGAAYNTVHVYNAASTRWSTIFAEGDPNERGVNAEPAPRYQNAISYVKEKNSIYIGGGLRKYTCEEFISKGTCHQYAACSWDDYEAIRCDELRDQGQNCYPVIAQSDNELGEFCRPVSASVCDSINPAEFPYNAPGNTLAQNECIKRPSCQWNSLTATCSLKANSPTSGEGWTDAKDFWQLDLTPLDDNDPDTYPTWKKLCDSQEPYLAGNPSNPNPAFRSCGLPAGTAGQASVYPDFDKNRISNPTRKMNMIWNSIRQKMYLTWEGRSEILSYDPYNNTFTTPTGAAAGLANSYQLIYNDWTGKTFAYKRGGINQLNSSVMAWEADPNEKHFIRAEVDLGEGSKQYAASLKPIVRASGRSTGSSTPNTGIEAYLYNYDTNQWVLLGVNSITSTNDVGAFQGAEIFQEYLGTAARQFISNDGKIQILITPRGNPPAGGSHEMYIESIAVEGRF